jgi:peptide/nickel transport system substrate-binding protein
VVTGEVDYHLAKDISIDDQTLRITLEDDFVWENGDPVTAADLSTQLKLGVIMENFARLNLLGDLVDETADITQVDEQTVTLELNQAVGEALTIPSAFGQGGTGGPILWTPESVFGKYIEEYEDATTEDARTSVQDSVLQFRWELEDVISNGIATLEDINNTVAIMSAHEAHPDSDSIPWDTVEHYYLSSQDQIIQSARSGELDIVTGRYEADALPADSWQTLQPAQLNRGGSALICNHADDIFGQTAVKQAIAHVIDRKQIGSLNSTFTPTADHLTMGETVIDQYVSSTVADNLTRYGSSDRASELLESAGFQQDDGLWYTPDGEQFTGTIHTPQNPTFREPARAIGSHLGDFGIEIEVIAQGGGTFFPNFSEGSYELVVEYARSGNVSLYSDINRNMYGFGGGSMQYPETVEAPPVGEPNGDLVTYEAKQLVDSLLTYDSTEELAPVVAKLIWIQNYTLPVIPLFISAPRVFTNTSRWNWPSADADAWHYMVTAPRMSVTGELQPR